MIKFFLPYFLRKLKSGETLVGRMVGEGVRHIKEWRHPDFSVTVNHTTGEIVCLVDYQYGVVYRGRNGGLAPVMGLISHLTDKVVAVPYGSDTGVWGASRIYTRSHFLTSNRLVTIDGWEVFAAPISVLRNGGVTVMGKYYPPSNKPVSPTPGRIYEDGTYLIVEEEGVVCNYAASQMQWCRERLVGGACEIDVCTPQTVLFGATFLPTYRPSPGAIATYDNDIAVVCLPIRRQRYGMHVCLVWRHPVPYPVWACCMYSLPKNVFVGKKYLYVSVSGAGGEYCYIWQINEKDVRYITHWGNAPADEEDLIKRCDELSWLIREGKSPFPVEDKSSPLWACSLVSVDKQYVQKCAELSWIPQIDKVEFLPPDGHQRAACVAKRQGRV